MAVVPRDAPGYHPGGGRAPRLQAGQEGPDPTLPCPAAIQPRAGVWTPRSRRGRGGGLQGAGLVEGGASP